MKKTKLLISSLFVASMLAACNTEDTKDNTESQGTGSNNSSGVEENDNDNDQNDMDDADSDSDSDSDGDADGDADGIFAEGNFDDQLDLGIGDTGTVETLGGIFEFTVNDVEIMEDVNGELSDLDFFLFVNFTVKNVGEEEVDARDAINILEATDFLEGTGFSDNAEYYEGLDSIEGLLTTGDEVTGDALYNAHDADEYYLRVTEGLVGSGAAKNQIRFTFQKSEIE